MQSSDNIAATDGPSRPEFAVVLGLLPPYSLEDVKRAYLSKVKSAHPDKGGDRVEFDRIQSAFEQATAYLSFRRDRRQWIAARMEEYVAVETLIKKLKSLGAEVETTLHDWVRQSFGDFATLTETIVAIRLPTGISAAELIDLVIQERSLLTGLKRLELPGAQVDDLQALQLRVFDSLTELDLSGTGITWRAASLVDWLRHLEVFNVADTAVGWWPRLKLNSRLRRRRAKRLSWALHPVNLR